MIKKSAYFLILIISLFSLGPSVSAAPSITNISQNLNQVPKYEKFESTFKVQSVAEYKNLPYDESPPTGIRPEIGITVWGQFVSPAGQTFNVPAFYYQDFEYQVKNNKDWLYPKNDFYFKLRFAPNQTGSWNYKIYAKDKSGESSVSGGSFNVTESSSKGFVRISNDDTRYFEYENGDYFVGLGYNEEYRGLDWINPLKSNTNKFNIMKNNNIEFIRMWLSQWSIFGVSWNPWRAHINNNYFPDASLRIVGDNIEEDLAILIDSSTNKCMVWGWETYVPPVKPNTNYTYKITYKAENLTPQNSSNPFGLALKISGWAWDESTKSCPGGEIISNYSLSNTTEYQQMTGSFNSGSRDGLDKLYMSLENTQGGRVYVKSIEIFEEQNGNLGVNILPKTNSIHLFNYDQRNSYAFDMVLKQAEESNVYLRPVLLEKNDHTQNRISYDGVLTTAHSNDNFYGDFKNETAVRWLQKAWFRYVQARWGYSTNIHSYELINEGNPASTRHYALADEMSKYFKCEVFGVGAVDNKCPDNFKHPNFHLTSTSFWSNTPVNAFWKNRQEYPNFDFADVHAYISTSYAPCNERIKMVEDAAYLHIWHTQDLARHNINMPIVRGETGMDGFVSDPNGDCGVRFVQSPLDINAQSGRWYKNFVWAQVSGGAGLIEQPWWVRDHVFNSQFDHRPILNAFYKFISTEPLNKGGYVDIDSSTSSNYLRIVGQKNIQKKRAHFWVQNKESTWNNSNPLAVSGSFTFDMPSGEYTLQKYSIETGNVIETKTVNVQNDVFNLEILNLKNSEAYKLITTDSVTPVFDKYDLNHDGVVNLNDVISLIKYLFGSGNTIQEDGDVDGNGNVDLRDVIFLIKYLFA